MDKHVDIKINVKDADALTQKVIAGLATQLEFAISRGLGLARMKQPVDGNQLYDGLVTVITRDIPR